MRSVTVLTAILAFLLVQATFAQPWPAKIRGYKVYDAKLDLASDASVRLVDARIAEAGFSGMTVDVDAEILSRKQGGTIDFVTFRDFKINGIPVEIEEYTHPFALKKGVPFLLPRPARIHLKTANVPIASIQSLRDDGRELDVTGTLFIFGKFKKFGFTFKRVVPVRVDMKISNPLTASAAFDL
ncbi:MAG TPA: hypothetical protein VNA17_08540 [Pyrinomonadaceae bacterium]|nr:hypothetical protein [Pyrinomonadaceae bacterium]